MCKRGHKSTFGDIDWKIFFEYGSNKVRYAQFCIENWAVRDVALVYFYSIFSPLYKVIYLRKILLCILVSFAFVT